MNWLKKNKWLAITAATAVISLVGISDPSSSPANNPAPVSIPSSSYQQLNNPQTPPAPSQIIPIPPPSSGLSNDNYYKNVDGNTVHSPAYSNDGSAPIGASAKCRDGTYSFSQNRRGTCSHHAGVS